MLDSLGQGSLINSMGRGSVDSLVTHNTTFPASSRLDVHLAQVVSAKSNGEQREEEGEEEEGVFLNSFQGEDPETNYRQMLFLFFSKCLKLSMELKAVGPADMGKQCVFCTH